MTIAPIRLFGNWDDGWALDRHTIKSEYTGDDPFGHPTFETTRSEIGELMFQLKYRNNLAAISKIVEAIHTFLNEAQILGDIDIILPAPPSKSRPYQPVFAIAEEFSQRYRIPYSDEALIKTSSAQSKEMTLEEKSVLAGSVLFVRKFIRPCNVLLLDDIFDSGGTLRACTTALRTDPNTRKVYVLTVTKAKGA